MGAGPKQIERGRVIGDLGDPVAFQQFGQQLRFGLQHLVGDVELVGGLRLHEEIGGVRQGRAAEDQARVLRAKGAAEKPRVRGQLGLVRDDFAMLEITVSRFDRFLKSYCCQFSNSNNNNNRNCKNKFKVNKL